MLKRIVAIAALAFAAWSAYEGFVVVQSTRIAMANYHANR